MRVVDIVIGVGWVIFWVGWLAASAGTKQGQRGRGNWARFAGVRVVLILVGVLLVRLRVLKGHGVVGNIRDPVLWGVGLAIWVLGLGLAVWARIYLGRNWGMPTSIKEDPELVTSGPYRTIRHPIYTGILLALIGSAVAVSVWWLIGVVLIGGYFIYSAFVEERNMTRLIPSAYPEYQTTSVSPGSTALIARASPGLSAFLPDAVSLWTFWTPDAFIASRDRRGRRRRLRRRDL
jgi:protein-S-isoprenylcysteine O-methyltransferase Ste14